MPNEIAKSIPKDPIFDVAGAAEYLGQTERWVRRSVAERRFPYIKLGRNLGFRQSDLDIYLEQQTVRAEV